MKILDESVLRVRLHDIYIYIYMHSYIYIYIYDAIYVYDSVEKVEAQAC